MSVYICIAYVNICVEITDNCGDNPRTLPYAVREIQKPMLKARILLKQLLAEFTTIAVASSAGSD